MLKALRSLIMFLARLCLAGVFLWGGVSKWIYYDQTIQMMAAKGFIMVPLFLTGASLVEVIGALSLIFGYRVRFGAAMLALFLISTTAIFHDFWNQVGEEQAMQLIHFLKNSAIFGGLLYVICCGAGGLGCDSYKPHPKPEVEPKHTRPEVEPKPARPEEGPNPERNVK